MTTNETRAERKARKKAEQEAYRAEHHRYALRFQWRNPNGPPLGTDLRNWRSWRVFASVPILFKTQQEAWEYLHRVGWPDFEEHRKMSAFISLVII